MKAAQAFGGGNQAHGQSPKDITLDAHVAARSAVREMKAGAVSRSSPYQIM